MNRPSKEYTPLTVPEGRLDGDPRSDEVYPPLNVNMGSAHAWKGRLKWFLVWQQQSLGSWMDKDQELPDLAFQLFSDSSKNPGQ